MEVVDNRTLKQKWHDFKGEVREKWNKFIAYAKENPDTVAGVLIVAIPIIGRVLLALIRYLRDYYNDRRDKTDYYDPRTGEHWYTKRPLNSRQKLNLEERYNRGESKGKILHDMNML